MEIETKDINIPSQIVWIWQRIVDSISILLSILSVMINRLEPSDLEVFRSNISPENPFPTGTRISILNSETKLILGSIIERDVKID